jgi:ADP-ribose pyrophosphatase
MMANSSSCASIAIRCSRSFLELPAGKIDPGEDILTPPIVSCSKRPATARQNGVHLGVMHPCVGYSDERIEIFLARGLQREADQNLDSGEFLDLLSLPLDEALVAVRKRYHYGCQDHYRAVLG